ncbi:Toll-like receptor 2 [Bagarius yarrelli]|uniref:Toll-like receptor 2 n=1 Tax=Bagarius yarrelli TaxID=175774 RepID=A0A556VWB5_BAGYA|nr:Toll-like receptor 2 [Bagarius yarrelli]
MPDAYTLPLRCLRFRDAFREQKHIIIFLFITLLLPLLRQNIKSPSLLLQPNNLKESEETLGSIRRPELSIFECHMILSVSILCFGTALILIFIGVTCYKLHIIWYLQMTVAWLRAKAKPAVRNAGAILRYDAFVSYSQHDAEWVEEILVPKLESSEPPFALCLHKRDFLPGRWIVDNIIESIESSYQALFVLSENFLTSEWCRYELNFSHFRIIDENNDSAVLILLEPIAKETIPKRFCKLRKIMNSRTYLEWPQDEERREEFWHNLRAALRREDY